MSACTIYPLKPLRPALDALEQFWWAELDLDAMLETAASKSTTELNATLSEMKGEMVGLRAIVECKTALVAPRDRRQAQLAIADVTRKMQHLKAFLTREHIGNQAEHDAGRKRARNVLASVSTLLRHDKTHPEDSAHVRIDRMRMAIELLLGELRIAWRVDDVEDADEA